MYNDYIRIGTGEITHITRVGDENSPLCGIVIELLTCYDFSKSKEVLMDVIKEDQVLDCSGMLCPMPVVKTSKAVKTMDIGQILKMIATDPGAPPDMEAWSRQTGNELLRSTEEDGKFVFYIRKDK
jgi:tRNA 2-thiouridine synthesizing protein A